MNSRYMHRLHNVSVLMYHIECAAKYRRVLLHLFHVDEVV